MTDRDVIAWARDWAEAATGDAALIYRRLADLAEKGATLLDCGQNGVCATAHGCMRHWAERNRELVAESAAEDWQPIATAPLDTRVLLLNDEGYVFTGEVYDGIGPLDDQGCRREATYWRYPPAPPGGGR
jgi:hypothetical protein